MPPDVPLHSRRTRALLAVAAVAVLVGGYALRPAAELPGRPIEEQTAPILRQVVEQREPSELFAALQETARRVLGVTARITVPAPPRARWSDWRPVEPHRATRYGVVLDGNRVLGDFGDLAAGTEVQVHVGASRNTRGWVVERFSDTRLGLAALDPALSPAPARDAGATATPGELVVAVAPGEEGPVIVPLSISERRGGALVVLGASHRLAGMPAFTAAGALVGVLAGADDELRIVPVRNVLSGPSLSAEPSPPLGLSLRVDRRTEDVRVVVDEVAPFGRAADGGVRVGDVLLAIDDVPVETLDEAASALEAAESKSLRLRVRRGPRSVVVRVAGSNPAR